MAFVLGLAPGKATEVPIVIVAEDGVTSLRYYLNIFRAELSKNSTGRGGSQLMELWAAIGQRWCPLGQPGPPQRRQWQR